MRSRVEFRSLSREDFPVLSRWLVTPHVARWWADDASPEAIEKEYGPGIDGLEPWEVFIVVLERSDTGLIQRYRIDASAEYLDELAPSSSCPTG